MSRRAGARKPPAVAIERRQLMNALHPVVRMLGTIVGSDIEVVLHDLTRPESSIVAIANGHVSNRRVGNSVLSGPKNDRGFVAAKQALSAGGQAVHSIVGDYPTLTRAGRQLKSSTVVFRDSGGVPFAALCVNADLTMMQAAHAWLDRQLRPSGGAAGEDRAEEPEMGALIKEIISDAVKRLGKPVNLMDREEKVQAVQAMMQRGLFIVKGGVERAAAALGVSRFTIYNYLDVLRERNGAPAPGAAAARAARAPATSRPPPSARRKPAGPRKRAGARRFASGDRS
jgi:predicted transcriptional regulator YheO